MLKVLVIPANLNQPLRIEHLEEDESTQLTAMQKIVGGWLEMAPIPTAEVTVFCNEEGKLHNLPFNARATELCEKLWNTPAADLLVGDVFVCGPTGAAGESTSIPDYVIQALLEIKR